jgi:arginine metabolism regulation protein II
VRLFGVFGNDTSPWKTIQIPRAIEAAGALFVTGKCSLIRQALLNTLLAASAFILASDYAKGHPKEVAERWLETAVQLRHKALGLLKESVSEQFKSSVKLPYKDFLITMLSMVSIDVRIPYPHIEQWTDSVKVMSGDTDSCTIHLNGCEQLIRMRRTSKTSYSSKARALHRVYLYLRSIHVSTLTLQGDEHLTGVFDNSSSNGWPDGSISDISVPDDPYHTPAWLDLTPDTKKTGMTFYKIYGIPETLAILIYNSGQVIRALERERGVDSDSSFIPDSLLLICNRLEEEILDWPSEAEAERCSMECECSTSATIMKNQIRAFHGALIIYFSQNVRHTAHQLLRPYVEQVLESVKAAEAVKSTAQLLAGPCFWPTFIASSAALDEHRQSEFVQLFSKMESYGFNAARSGHNIIHEIWQNWRTEKVYLRWRTLVKEKRITLMLT